MPRAARIQLAGALYYVTCRGDHDRTLFQDAQDVETYRALLDRAQRQHRVRVAAQALLPDQVCLVLEPAAGATLPPFMHTVNSAYTKVFNRRHQLKGHLFQERYRLVLVEQEPYAALLNGYVAAQAQPLGEKMAPELEAFGAQLQKQSIIGSESFMEQARQAAAEAKTKHLVPVRARPSKPAMVVMGVVVGLAVVGVTVSGLRWQARLKAELARRAQGLEQRLASERTRIAQDLDEKYRADQVSLHAMIKRLEIEKARVQTLEGQLR